MRIQHVPSSFFPCLNSSENLILLDGRRLHLRLSFRLQCWRRREGPALFELVHERLRLRGIIARTMKHEALEVRRDADVHGRCERLDGRRRPTVSARGEEPCQDVVRVRGYYQTATRAAHLLRVPSREH